MILSDLVAIVADDLTGANDTALQFHKKGADARILLDSESLSENKSSAEVWAISTESRNVNSGEAVIKVGRAMKTFIDNFSFDYYYKKIDSTLRGNIALEILTILTLLEYDASIIIPAFPQEGRITVGGYHICKGVPIEKTEMAIDPHSPIRESHIPTLLKSQLYETSGDIVGVIDLKTVMKGAGPILVKINELLESGKKLIVADATSTVDIEQIALAIKKSEKKILPSGTASGAEIFAKYWLIDNEEEKEPVKVENLPKLIISGTATQITAKQIDYLRKSEKYLDIHTIALDLKDILDNNIEYLKNIIIDDLSKNIAVCIHTSSLISDFDGFSEDSLNAGLTKEKLSDLITNFLAELTQSVTKEIKVILITLGGETSYKCCKILDARELKLLDEVAPAISLCKDNFGRYIITKSGNLGDETILVKILDYLKEHE